MTESLTIKIDDEKSIFLVNEEKKEVDIEKFIMRLQIIVASWELIMVNHSILDGIWYEIDIKAGNKVRKYIGKNKFPSNYDKFIELINEVAEW